MSIASQIKRIKDNIASAYAAIRERGGAVPSQQNSNNLVSAINTIPTGTDTSDADAIASDIVKGKTAYVNGEKITGNIFVLAPGYQSANSISRNSSSGRIYFNKMWTERVLSEKETQCGLYANGSNFGNATAADVASGKTFTSANGLNIAGVGDSNLIASNIKGGVSIFGVTGKYRKEYNLKIANNSSYIVVMKYFRSTGGCNDYQIKAGSNIDIPANGFVVLTSDDRFSFKNIGTDRFSWVSPAYNLAYSLSPGNSLGQAESFRTDYGVVLILDTDISMEIVN